MSALLTELAEQGFEILRDESGQDLVKLVFMDENEEATGYALVSPEEAKRIISGQATLQNVLDEDGKQVLTLASLDSEDLESVSVQQSAGVVNQTKVEGTIESFGNQNDESSIDTCISENKPSSSQPVEDSTILKEHGDEQVSENVEKYILSEQTAIVDNNQIQLVTLTDARGEILDQKQGQAGEQVILEMHGQAFSYEIQGPTENGEPITSTLLVSSADAEDQVQANNDGQTVSMQSADDTQPSWNENNAERVSASEYVATNETTPAGQQYTLTEMSAIVDEQPIQTVILADENGNVLDQKQGQRGEHTIIEMNGSSLEYTFLGPTETGQPITTTLVVTTESEILETPQPKLTQESSDETESGLTASKWCPPGLPSEFYTILRRQAEIVVATRCPRNADSSLNRLEPYHRKLGSYTAYMEMVEMVNNYRVGASQGETLELYESLRNCAKIYRTSGPQSRALTKYELALNEAAAQICRFQPGLLFHKRDLYHLAKETVERSQTSLNTERRHQNQQIQQQLAQQSQYKQQRSSSQANSQILPKSKVSTSLVQPLCSAPQTVAVGGRVASSQLALLESRGLSAIQQAATSNGTTVPATSHGEMCTSESSTLTFNQTNMQSTLHSTFSNKTNILSNDNNMNYLSSMPMVKRDSLYKITPSEEEAIRAAVVDVLSDFSHLDLKLKSDCTNIERACWDHARQLTFQTKSVSSVSGSMEHINNLQSHIFNESRVDSIRDAAALYGRPPGGIQHPSVAGLPRSASIPVLTPYEIACNESAAYLASGMPSLLTHRRELAELAKKVVRNSGCLFTHTPTSEKISIGGGGYRFYCSDQLPELDLSTAEQILTDPLDRSDSPDSGCAMNSDNLDTDNSAIKCGSVALSCQECNNVIDDVTIYSVTGTDFLKRVRILNLSNCGFTGLIPMYLNQCMNLVELNLSGNAFYALPRCLHLPKLRRLNIRNNPNFLSKSSNESPVEPPLVEQFSRLVSLDLDVELAKLLSPQSLAYLCPYLKTINGEEFVEEPKEETISIAQVIKNNLSTLIYSKWEDDIAGFYKKGLPKRDAICVIETLVLHAVNRTVESAKPFTHCISVLARRIAEDFLGPKMLDDECEDETAEKSKTNSLSDDEGAGSDTDSDSQEDEEATNEVDSSTETSVKPSDGQINVFNKSRIRKPKKNKSLEAVQASVAEREAEAAANNLALLPDDPPDRLINVVGQAMRHGKTVVYSVMRTAARQANGELIPVGGLGSSTANLNSVQTLHSVESLINKSTYEDEYDESDTENTPVQQPVRTQTPIVTKLPARQPLGGAVLGTRRPGLLNRASSSPSTRSPIISNTARGYTNGIATITQRKLQASDYIIRPSTNASESAYIVPNIQVQPKQSYPWTPGRRGRPPLALSLAKKAAAAEAEAKETSNLIKSVTIPPPHAPPPSTMRMSTRDSNRHKRFSAYGVIDRVAVLAGNEDALFAAALALEDDKETTAAEKILQQSAVVLSEGDTAAAEAAAIETQMKERSRASDMNDDQHELESKPRSDSSPASTKKSVEFVKTPETNKDRSFESPQEVEKSFKDNNEENVRRRRGRPSNAQLLAVAKESVAVTVTPKKATARKRTMPPTSVSDEPVENKKKFSVLSTPAPQSPVSETGTVSQSNRSLSQLGEMVDYDPLHFIRCHAQDNDPLDCETKVWRCAFEPLVDDPHNKTSTVVATCGGECVCLIDCKSGRVMKRFKHLCEEFYTLAWTTVEISSGHKTNLLAAAGKSREIRLLHPEQLVCYAEMRGHKSDVSCMIFHPTKPTILFSGDSKAYVLVWDIGIPSAPEYTTRHQLLMRLVCPRANLNPVLNLVFLSNHDALVAGCEDGIFSWTLKEIRKEKLSDEKEADLELKIPTHQEPCFDGLTKLNDDLLVVKCVEEGELYVVDYRQISNRRRRSGPLKKAVNLDIRGQLRWQTTDEIYINVTARPGLSAVICGDNEGTIWLYDLQKQIGQDAGSDKFKAKPVKILEWPECSIGATKDDESQLKESITSGFKNPIVNTTDISHDGEYLVAVTDNNLVCIWKFSG